MVKSTDVSTLRTSFIHVEKSLIKLGFTMDSINAIFKTLSSILNLGNIQFDAISDNACSIDNTTHSFLSNAAAMLNVDVLELECILTGRMINVADQQIK